MRRASIATFTTLTILSALPASATFHIMVVDEMFPGFEQAPGAQYVTLQLQAPLQTVVYEQPLPVFDGAGNSQTPFATFCSMPRQSCVLPAVSPACSAGDCPMPFDAEGSRILVATLWAQDLFCVTADLLATGTLPYPDGRVCFGDCDLRPDCPSGPVDCLAYGNFTGDNGIFGNPAVSPVLGEALVGSPQRQNQFLGGNLLDNSLGFSPGVPMPQNFHGDVGALDGLAGDADGTGVVDAGDVETETGLLFEADSRCAFPPLQRGADANLDTRVNAADVVATIQIVAADG